MWHPANTFKKRHESCTLHGKQKQNKTKQLLSINSSLVVKREELNKYEINFGAILMYDVGVSPFNKMTKG